MMKDSVSLPSWVQRLPFISLLVPLPIHAPCFWLMFMDRKDLVGYGSTTGKWGCLDWASWSEVGQKGTFLCCLTLGLFRLLKQMFPIYQPTSHPSASTAQSVMGTDLTAIERIYKRRCLKWWYIHTIKSYDSNIIIQDPHYTLPVSASSKTH